MQINGILVYIYIWNLMSYKYDLCLRAPYNQEGSNFLPFNLHGFDACP